MVPSIVVAMASTGGAAVATIIVMTMTAARVATRVAWRAVRRAAAV